MKLTKNQAIYESLMLYFTEQLYQRPKNEENLNNLNSENEQKRKDLLDNILDNIAKILLNYTIVDSKMSLTLGDRNKLYTQLENTINDSIIDEIKRERLVTKDILTNVIKEKYNTENYIWSLGNTKPFKIIEIDKDKLNKILDNKFKGEDEDIAKNWSERIWNNKNELAKDLKLNINKFLKGDISVNDIKKIIQTKYKARPYETERLVRTEITRVQVEANDLWGNAYGIKKQLYLAVLDNKTSKICRNRDGIVVDINDPDKPTIPAHSNCRSLWLNLPSNSDWRPKTRWDNENKVNIDWTDYENWSKNQKS